MSFNFENIPDLNWWAIIIAVVFNSLLGIAWYSPFLFGKLWQKALKKPDGELGNQQISMFISIVGSFIAVTGFALILGWAQATTLIGGAKIGFLIAIIITYSVFLNNAFQGKSFSLSAIDSSYLGLFFILTGALLGYWYS